MDIRAALNGQDDAATFSINSDSCRYTGLAVIAYSASKGADFVVGSMSRTAFNRFLATGDDYDAEMVAAYATIGLAYDGYGGEALLMNDWTWEQHSLAKSNRLD